MHTGVILEVILGHDRGGGLQATKNCVKVVVAMLVVTVALAETAAVLAVSCWLRSVPACISARAL